MPTDSTALRLLFLSQIQTHHFRRPGSCHDRIWLPFRDCLQHLIIKRILARNLKKRRSQLDLTQEQAAEKVNITAKYWQRLEMTSQVDLPSLPTLFKISKALGIEAYLLLKE
ncbi:MAG: helix-turn-helix transcriptional regulator [Planctomycetes bacterium]|nr:helix-turn-helix transcriptional regulator [Planctomycetota bacterium]